MVLKKHVTKDYRIVFVRVPRFEIQRCFFGKPQLLSKVPNIGWNCNAKLSHENLTEKKKIYSVKA